MVFAQPMRFVTKLVTQSTLLCMAFLFSLSANAEYKLNFQDPVTEIARDIYGLHMLIFWVCVVIFVVVFSIMFYSIFAHRKSKNYQASTFSHSTGVEIVWTTIPFIILALMAWPATKVLIEMEDTTKSDLVIKITGYQWKWGYEYLGLDNDISFYSTLTTPRNQIEQFDKENAVPQGPDYLLEVDNHLVVPSGRKVRALITSNDVIHAWWIPAFGTKKDAVPGYINELWFNVDVGKEGTYKGQCAELCGKDHAFMPIVVDVVTGEQFDEWVASGGKTLVSVSNDDVKPLTEVIAEPESITSVIEKITPVVNVAGTDSGSVKWNKESLLTKGETVYNTNCGACHGFDGEGVAGVFPAIAGSAVANGSVEEHIKIVMNGKSGSGMMAFAGHLSDEEIASVITYQRNAFGNETGDVVLPADIKAKR